MSCGVSVIRYAMLDDAGLTMQSQKPYLIRAIHEWCSDQGFTPYLSVEVDAHTRVPQGFVRDGVIVLNAGLEATHQLVIGNEDITFQARFGGRAFPVRVPIERVQAIYARENGQGMAFEVSEVGDVSDGSVKRGSDGAIAIRAESAPGLHVASVSDLSDGPHSESDLIVESKSESDSDSDSDSKPDPTPEPETPGGRPQLKRIK
jgi:stringent starvation protein B